MYLIVFNVLLFVAVVILAAMVASLRWKLRSSLRTRNDGNPHEFSSHDGIPGLK